MIYDLDWRQDGVETADIPEKVLTLVSQMELQCHRQRRTLEPVVLWSLWCNSYSQFLAIEQVLHRMARRGLTTLIRQVTYVVTEQPHPWAVITADMIDDFYFHVLSLFDFERKERKTVTIHSITDKMTRQLSYAFEDAQTARIMQIFEKQGMGVSVNKDAATVELEAPLWMLDRTKFLAYQTRMYEAGEMRTGHVNYHHYLSHVKGNLHYSEENGQIVWPSPSASVPQPLINFWKDLLHLEFELEMEGLGK